VLQPAAKQNDELAPHKHPVPKAAQAPFDANKNPELHPKQKPETPVAVATAVARFDVIEAAAAQEAQLVAVVHAVV
jgi:hypothetical protein